MPSDTSTSGPTTTVSIPATTPSTTQAGGGSATCAWTDTGGAAKPVSMPPATVAKKNYTATIETSVGTLRVQLTGSATPCTVASFVSLAKQGYFNNTFCHRMGNTAGFEFLQCGDPTGTGTGGPGYTIPDEITGSETYKAGTLAMANTGAPDSGGSQFFMVFGDSQFSPNYTVFGQLDAASIAVLKRVGAAGIGAAGPAGGGAPKEKVTFKSVTIS
ncbi:hypothetical protein Back2_03100 [Nocardioides baekrokdamisoli]|uniref:PPIase cyclophilin-type domain-containing protein n=2 Tax=Nocardioides baekrokdamisoli TaxID=1804624 RepID=A0A3G9IUW4_9ACTN|nr:hypothetical protein Back2_03100 [Nocardioides baekrokdamisoli]